jgi:hypothetical protein
MDSSKQNRQLAVVERLGGFAWKWLGVRDDFRNWLLTAGMRSRTPIRLRCSHLSFNDRTGWKTAHGHPV